MTIRDPESTVRGYRLNSLTFKVRRLGCASHGDLLRHRRPAQRRQVHPLQRALRRGRRRRPTTRSAPSSRTSAWCRCRTSGSTQLVALVKPQKTIRHLAGVRRHRRPGARRVQGRGPGQPVPRQHPPGRRDAHVVRCFEDDNVIHVEGRVDPVARHRRPSTPSCASRTSRRSRSASSGPRRALEGAGGQGGEGRARRCCERVKAGPRRRQAGARAEAHRRGAGAHPRAVLLTAKPVFYVANVDEKQLGERGQRPARARRCGSTPRRRARRWW